MRYRHNEAMTPTSCSEVPPTNLIPGITSEKRPHPRLINLREETSSRCYLLLLVNLSPGVIPPAVVNPWMVNLIPVYYSRVVNLIPVYYSRVVKNVQNCWVSTALGWVRGSAGL